MIFAIISHEQEEFMSNEIPDFVVPKRHMSLEFHGSYPQAADIARSEGFRPGSSEWMKRIREIRSFWISTGQIGQIED